MNKRQTSMLVMVGILVFVAIISVSTLFISNDVGMLTVTDTNTTVDSIADDKYLADPTYCEKEEDCVIEIFRIDNCCWTCDEIAMNKKTSGYWERWREENCDYGSCILAECQAYNTTVKCVDNHCRINVKGETVYQDDIIENKRKLELDRTYLKKIEPKITNQSTFCNGDQSDQDCMCQKGYIRVIYGNGLKDCYPELCTYIQGAGMSGEVLFFNSEICASMSWILENRCDEIDGRMEKEICQLVYTQLTGDRKVCGQITDQRLVEKCVNIV